MFWVVATLTFITFEIINHTNNNIIVIKLNQIIYSVFIFEQRNKKKQLNLKVIEVLKL